MMLRMKATVLMIRPSGVFICITGFGQYIFVPRTSSFLYARFSLVAQMASRIPRSIRSVTL